MRVAEWLDRLHARIQVKLAQQGMPTDRDTLADVCMAIACLVRDPDGLRLHSSPLPAEEYAVVQECLALASRDFAAEIGALRALIASLEGSLQGEVQRWIAAGQVTPHEAPHVIREWVLARFVPLHDDGPADQRHPDAG
jgi:hypothetical protein